MSDKLSKSEKIAAAKKKVKYGETHSSFIIKKITCYSRKKLTRQSLQQNE